MIEYVG